MDEVELTTSILTMSRRDVALMFGMGLTSVAATNALAKSTPADRAVLFGFAPYEFARLRNQAQLRYPLNQINHRRTLSDHSARAITTPNNDTLYSSAWIDLSSGPMILELPPSGDRYLSIMLLDPMSDNFEILGSRTTGNSGGRFLFAGPSWSGNPPLGVRVVRCPVDDAWLLARLLVNGESDLSSAIALQSGIRLQANANTQDELKPSTTFPKINQEAGDPDVFIQTVRAVLDRMPMAHPQAHRGKQLLEAVSTSDLIGRAIQDAKPILMLGNDQGSMTTGHWSISDKRIGRFGTNDLLRARTALTGFGALVTEEAMYFGARNDQFGQVLNGNNQYSMTIPNSGVPTDGFWSLSLYEIDPSGRLFFTPNAINRFAIGNRTPSLQFNQGRLEILIGANPPSLEKQTNWLPAPKGPFQLTLRAYLPRRSMLRHRWQPPAIMKT
jgi:hypothetical protein